MLAGAFMLRSPAKAVQRPKVSDCRPWHIQNNYCTATVVWAVGCLSMLVVEEPLSRLTIRSLETSDDWLFLSDGFFRNSITSKINMAKRMNTSRAKVDRFLDVTDTHLTLAMLVRVAIALNKTIRVELVN
jgi:hypothetical protein